MEDPPAAGVDLDTAHVPAHHDAPALLLRIHPRRGLREADFAALAHWAEGIRSAGS